MPFVRVPRPAPGFLLATLSIAASSALHAQQREMFVTLAGRDTIAVERFRRTPGHLDGEIETRVSGRTSRITYAVLTDARSGRPLRLEYSLTIPQMGLSINNLDISADSAIGPTMLNEREGFYRGAFPAGSVPVLAPLSLALLEELIRATPATPGPHDVRVFSWGNLRTIGPTIRKVTLRADGTYEVPDITGLRLTMRGGTLVSARSATGDTITIRAVAPEPKISLALSPMASGRAPTPPMGWNSWNKFGCRIDEALIRETADAMVSSGMLAAGYHYLNIDDCWEARERTATGSLAVDSVRFPSGMKKLVDYVHGKGLKVGIYSSGGTGTCQGRPATLDHEIDDARLFASWEIDYVKYDNCNARNRPEQIRFKAMIDAVKAAGRNTVFSICEWGEARPWLWGRQLGGQLWRTTEDIRDSWLSMLGILDQQVGLEAYAGPDGWNDPDMLEVGNGKMTHDEYVAHFSLWALLNAPLIAGNDLRAMDAATAGILMNRDVIAVDQDWGGRQGARLRDDGSSEVWMKPMSDGGRAVVLFNRATTEASIEVSLAELGMSRSFLQRLFGGGTRHATDLWSGEKSEVRGTIVRRVPAHGAVMLRIR